MQNKPVLVAVDFSEGSESALHWAADICSGTSVPLIIVHVIHDPAHAPGFYKRGQDDQLKPVQEVAQTMFDAFLQQASLSRPENTSLESAQTVLVKGSPAKRILAVAKKTGAGHIVLGYPERARTSKIFVGSVVKKVLEKSPLPVTIIKTQAQETEPKNKDKAEA